MALRNKICGGEVILPNKIPFLSMVGKWQDHLRMESKDTGDGERKVFIHNVSSTEILVFRSPTQVFFLFLILLDQLSQSFPIKLRMWKNFVYGTHKSLNMLVTNKMMVLLLEIQHLLNLLRYLQFIFKLWKDFCRRLCFLFNIQENYQFLLNCKIFDFKLTQKAPDKNWQTDKNKSAK